MSWAPRTKAGKALAAAAFVAASLTAIVTAYRTLDIDKPAWASDVQRLDRQQVETAIEVYQNKYRMLLLQPKPENPAAERAWEIELDRTLRNLGRAEDHKIELSR